MPAGCKDHLEEILNCSRKVECFQHVSVEGITLILHPGVYPSHVDSTTKDVIGLLPSFVNNKTICDMGCGFGVIGEIALRNNALSVALVDSNPKALCNALANKMLHHRRDEDMEIIQSDCFDSLTHQKFDYIIFSPPFEEGAYEQRGAEDIGVFDRNFRTLSKFLRGAKRHMHSRSKILLAYPSGANHDAICFRIDEARFKRAKALCTEMTTIYELS